MSTFHRHIPPELIDIIIDYLHSDVYSLKACHLVCKAWQSAARHHLFCSIHLDLSLPLKALEGFLSHVAQPSSYFHTTLRTLSLRSEFAPERQHDLTWLASLRNIASLVLSFWYIAMPDPHWFRGATGVIYLELVSCRVDFQSFSRQFPKLEVLKLVNVSWIDRFDIDEVVRGGAVLKCLRKLHLGLHSFPVVPALTTLISRGIIQGKIEEITLEGVERTYERSVGALLRAVGTSLRSLVISAENILDVKHAFALEKNLNLKSVHFSELVDPRHYMGSLSLNWVIAFLLQLPSSMERITFSFWLIPGDTLGLDLDLYRGSIYWPKIMQAMGNLEQLKCVELRLGAELPHRLWIKGKCREHFPDMKWVLKVADLHDCEQ